MTELLNTLLNLFVIIFVLASMFGLGLSLTLKQMRFRKCALCSVLPPSSLRQANSCPPERREVGQPPTSQIPYVHPVAVD